MRAAEARVQPYLKSSTPLPQVPPSLLTLTQTWHDDLLPRLGLTTTLRGFNILIHKRSTLGMILNDVLAVTGTESPQ